MECGCRGDGGKKSDLAVGPSVVVRETAKRGEDDSQWHSSEGCGRHHDTHCTQQPKRRRDETCIVREREASLDIQRRGKVARRTTQQQQQQQQQEQQLQNKNKSNNGSKSSNSNSSNSSQTTTANTPDTARPRVVSIISVSKEKRFVTRPMGVVSKNSMGARNTLVSRPTNRRLAACRAMN